MPQMKQDKQIKRGDIDFHYSDTVMPRTIQFSYYLVTLTGRMAAPQSFSEWKALQQKNQSLVQML